MTNPVASLAALLEESPVYIRDSEGNDGTGLLVAWLLARGVQYAPREPDATLDRALAVGLLAKSDREWQVEAVRLALDKRLRDYDFTIRDGTYPRDLAEIAVDTLARGRPEGPSAPPGPWRIEDEGYEDEYWMVVTGDGKPRCVHCGSFGRDYDETKFGSNIKAEAEAVRDALNRVASLTAEQP